MKRWAQQVAVRLAATSMYDRYLHGALIERGGRIISRGVNASRPLAPQPHKYSIHAEAAAIRNGRGQIGDLYVARVTRGNVRNSRPCDECMILIKKARIKRVFYSITNNEWGVIDMEKEIIPYV